MEDKSDADLRAACDHLEAAYQQLSGHRKAHKLNGRAMPYRAEMAQAAITHALVYLAREIEQQKKLERKP